MRGGPSMTALLALVALAGYQNRDKIAEMLGGLGGGSGRQPNPAEAGRAGGQAGGVPGALGGALGGGIGGVLSSGIKDLVDSFRQAGQGETVDSWVARGPNREIAPNQLEQAIGPETLETLSRQTGLSREEILARLTRDLPTAVDRYTPDGRIPEEDEPPRRA